MKLVEMPVKGVSMLPTLPSGSRIQVELCDERECRLGDLVVYSRKNRLIVHRLVARSEAGPVFWGDGRPFPDEQVDRASVLGRVVAVARAGGAFSAFPSWTGRAWVARRALRTWARRYIPAPARRALRSVADALTP